MEFKASRRVMVDMSATILHHGHIRLLKKASEMGTVVVALCTDDEVLKWKGYTPEISFLNRKEIIASIRYVSEVVPSPWLVNLDFIDAHRIDYLVHGDDNPNPIPQERLIIFPRTPGISSCDVRERMLGLNNAWKKPNPSSHVTGK